MALIRDFNLKSPQALIKEELILNSNVTNKWLFFITAFELQLRKKKLLYHRERLIIEYFWVFFSNVQAGIYYAGNQALIYPRTSKPKQPHK